MRRVCAVFLSLLIFSLSIVLAAEPKSPQAAFWWALLVPGGGHFYLGDKARGAAYFAATAGAAGWGLSVEGRRSGNEINTPLIYAQQIHAMQIYTAYREALSRSGARDKILAENSSLSRLAAAPFKKENLKNPWLIGFALLGAGLNYAAVRIDGAQRDFWDVRRAQILGDRFNRDTGFAVHSAYWLPLSLGAGVSEEMIFRGMIQTGWEERWGKNKGLLAASALFGLAHFDGKRESLGNVLFASAAGTYLGWRFQKRDYRLSEVIAAHFWFDALAGVTLYLADPENNPLGAKMEYRF